MKFAQVVFVTGISGAGKSQAMKAFEDLGFYCIDNLPPTLAARTLALLDESEIRRVAVALDARTGGTLGDASAVLDGFRHDGVAPSVLFLDARDDAIVRRYSETRRRHPLSDSGSVLAAIAGERDALARLRERADTIIDTTSLNQSELRNKIRETYSAPQSKRLSVTILSFGFKYGLPLDLDLLFDVRFLRNPNYVDHLQPLTGEDAEVGAYIEQDPATRPFLGKITDLVDFLVPKYAAEGKSQLTIGFGCTGGRHRSVYLARQLFLHLKSNEAVALHIQSRDSGR